MTTAFVIGASSDIGAALCRRWRRKGWDVIGTFRTESDSTRALRDLGVDLVQLDLAGKSETFSLPNQEWQVLVIAPATLEPIGPFEDADFHAWADGFDLNCLFALQLIHALLPARRRVPGGGRKGERSPAVITLAGAGTNGPAPDYSAYALAKVALIKAMELLDAEIPDTRFISIGPGWVRTKIHDQTLKAGDLAGVNLQRTQDMLSGDDGWTDMERVLNCCDWALSQPREVIGGRNISVEGDPWEHPDFPDRLRSTPDLNKLRRLG